MNLFVIFTICYSAVAHARPYYSQGSHIKLEGVPNESHYGKLTYPKFDIIELGSAIKGSLPPAIVEINKKVIIKEPKPYPVKVPVPVPHPVEVVKPYPVIQTKIIKVPHPVPYEVIKKVPVPFEVPKPYPVSHEEFKAPHAEAPIASYGSSFEGHDHLGAQHLDELPEEEKQQEGGYEGGYENGFQGTDYGGGYAEADQSQSYEAQAPVEHPTGWIPVGEAQQNENHE